MTDEEQKEPWVLVSWHEEYLDMKSVAESLDQQLKAERARSAKLVEAAARALRFGFVTTEKGGVLICVASELRKALAEYEAGS